MRKDIANQISVMKETGLMNKSELARRFNCDWRTVDKYIDNQQRIRKKREYSSILEEYKGIVVEKVDLYGVSSMAVFKFIQQKGYKGSYLTVNNFVQQHKNEEIKKATIRFETTPGLQAQVDWKEKILFECMFEAFRYFYGIPQEILCDNHYTQHICI